MTHYIIKKRCAYNRNQSYICKNSRESERHCKLLKRWCLFIPLSLKCTFFSAFAKKKRKVVTLNLYFCAMRSSSRKLLRRANSGENYGYIPKTSIIKRVPAPSNVEERTPMRSSITIFLFPGPFI